MTQQHPSAAHGAVLLPSGNMLIPARADVSGLVGDGLLEITPEDDRYDEWLPHAVPAPVGVQVRRAREAAGLSQYQLPEATGGAVSAPGLCRIELGQRYPTLHTLEALTRVLPVRVQVEGGRTRVVPV